VFLQENFQLLAKAFFTMMFLLRLDVMNRVLHARNADAERTKTFLPCEVVLPEFGESFSQPF
jgi:hypothetical protein